MAGSLADMLKKCILCVCMCVFFVGIYMYVCICMCIHKVYFVRFSVSKFNRFAARQQKLYGVFVEAFNHPAKLAVLGIKTTTTKTNK